MSFVTFCWLSATWHLAISCKSLSICPCKNTYTNYLHSQEKGGGTYIIRGKHTQKRPWGDLRTPRRKRMLYLKQWICTKTLPQIRLHPRKRILRQKHIPLHFLVQPLYGSRVLQPQSVAPVGELAEIVAEPLWDEVGQIGKCRQRPRGGGRSGRRGRGDRRGEFVGGGHDSKGGMWDVVKFWGRAAVY